MAEAAGIERGAHVQEAANKLAGACKESSNRLTADRMQAQLNRRATHLFICQQNIS